MAGLWVKSQNTSAEKKTPKKQKAKKRFGNYLLG